MKLGKVIAILRSFDATKAREFYCGFLGFKVSFEHRFAADAPLYMGLVRGEVILHLSEHHGDATPGSAIRIETEDLDALHREVTAKDYPNARPGIVEQPWGYREMIVTDPFGNRLIFAEEVSG